MLFGPAFSPLLQPKGKPMFRIILLSLAAILPLSQADAGWRIFNHIRLHHKACHHCKPHHNYHHGHHQHAPLKVDTSVSYRGDGTWPVQVAAPGVRVSVGSGPRSARVMQLSVQTGCEAERQAWAEADAGVVAATEDRAQAAAEVAASEQEVAAAQEALAAAQAALDSATVTYEQAKVDYEAADAAVTQAGQEAGAAYAAWLECVNQ